MFFSFGFAVALSRRTKANFSLPLICIPRAIKLNSVLWCLSKTFSWRAKGGNATRECAHPWRIQPKSTHKKITWGIHAHTYRQTLINTLTQWDRDWLSGGANVSSCLLKSMYCFHRLNQSLPPTIASHKLLSLLIFHSASRCGLCIVLVNSINSTGSHISLFRFYHECIVMR